MTRIALGTSRSSASGRASVTVGLRGRPRADDSPSGSWSEAVSTKCLIDLSEPLRRASTTPRPRITIPGHTPTWRTAPQRSRIHTLLTPPDGASYDRGQVVAARYSCHDAPDGPGLKSCLVPVADGSPIDTTTDGLHTFTVTARQRSTSSSFRLPSCAGICARSPASRTATATSSPCGRSQMVMQRHDFERWKRDQHEESPRALRCRAGTHDATSRSRRRGRRG